MATTDFNAGSGGRDKRTGDTQLFFPAQQAVRVGEFERQPQHGSDRRKRDIAFIPGQTHAQHLLALPFAHADDAGIRNGAGIGTRFRAGQREARNFLTASQAWQIVVFLLFRTVMLQQLARA